MRPNECVPDLLARLRQFVMAERDLIPIESAYLFGSWAHGEPTADSDIDVAVITRRKTSLEEETHVALDAKDFNSSIDVLFFPQREFESARRGIVEDIKKWGIRIL